LHDPARSARVEKIRQIRQFEDPEQLAYDDIRQHAFDLEADP
jgi:hypothetical protein